MNVSQENQKVNIPAEGSWHGGGVRLAPPDFLSDNPAVKLHESSVRSARKNIKKTNREIEKFFRYQNIYDYERKPARDGYFDESPEEKSCGYGLTISTGGQLVEIKRKLGSKPEELGKSKGDVIEGYSRESRNRFIKLLLSINYSVMGAPIFYTLTYPGEFSNDPRRWKRDLKRFIERLRRHYPGLTGTWRLEPQKRGAPHFCGFLWGCDDLDTVTGKKWFSAQWFEVVGSGDEKHLRAGTGLSRELMIETRIFYMAKYQTKDEKGGVKQEFDYPVGRYWGVFERKKLAIKNEEFALDRNLFFKLRRVMKKLLEKRLTKNKFREVVKGKQNGLWMKMSNQDIEKLLTLYVDESE